MRSVCCVFFGIIEKFKVKLFLCINLDRRIAHIGWKIRTNPPSFAKFRFFFLFALWARLVLSSHDVSAAQRNLVERDCQRVHESCAVGVAMHDFNWGVINASNLLCPQAYGRCTKRLRSRWYQHFSSFSIAQHAVCHSCQVLSGIRHGRTSQNLFFRFKFFFVLVEGEAAINRSQTLLLLVRLSRFESLRPRSRKSRQAFRSKKNNTLEVNLWLRPV